MRVCSQCFNIIKQSNQILLDEQKAVKFESKKKDKLSKETVGEVEQSKKVKNDMNTSEENLSSSQNIGKHTKNSSILSYDNKNHILPSTVSKSATSSVSDIGEFESATTSPNASTYYSNNTSKLNNSSSMQHEDTQQIKSDNLDDFFQSFGISASSK